MEKPKLSKMCETFVKIGLPNQIPIETGHNIIRFKLYPFISDLKKRGTITWFHFLVHSREHGVPTTPDDDNLYFHIRVSLADDIEFKDFEKLLPDYCVLTQPCKKGDIENISITKTILFDITLFKSEGIEEVWRFLGEQSEWLLNFLYSHKEDADIPLLHIYPFLHYFCNMTQISVKCPQCKSRVPL